MYVKSLPQVLGGNIASRRRKLGLSQMALAERLGIGQDALSRMEQGKISPKISRLRELAAILECGVASLFREEDDKMDVYLAEILELLLPLEQRKRDAVIRAMRELVNAVR